MALADIERWNQKYAAASSNPAFTPDAILTQYAHLLDGRGLALDVACGVGHNALYLARRGYEVIAVDGSLAGLRYCREQLAATPLPVHLVAADLDQFIPPPERFALVLVVRYLNRPLIAHLKRALVPGGLMIYQTFNRHRLLMNPDFNPDYLVEPGELNSLFADFAPIASNDAPDMRDPISAWIGRRPMR
jgi:SAM-dependent methyltransferase